MMQSSEDTARDDLTDGLDIAEIGRVSDGSRDGYSPGYHLADISEPVKRSR